MTAKQAANGTGMAHAIADQLREYGARGVLVQMAEHRQDVHAGCDRWSQGQSQSDRTLKKPDSHGRVLELLTPE